MKNDLMPTVLLVEAETSLMQRMGWILLEAGYVTARVPFAADVPPKLRTFSPDVIVMNNEHADAARREMISLFRTTLPSVRVIDVHAAGHTVVRDHETGADSYLHFPFDADDLVSAIEQVAS